MDYGTLQGILTIIMMLTLSVYLPTIARVVKNHLKVKQLTLCFPMKLARAIEGLSERISDE
ncbi:hypothetical protein P4S55_25095 [Shewanella sp. PP-Sp27a-2]